MIAASLFPPDSIFTITIAAISAFGSLGAIVASIITGRNARQLSRITQLREDALRDERRKEALSADFINLMDLVDNTARAFRALANLTHPYDDVALIEETVDAFSRLGVFTSAERKMQGKLEKDGDEKLRKDFVLACVHLNLALNHDALRHDDPGYEMRVTGYRDSMNRRAIRLKERYKEFLA